ncbi:MAG: Asp23/Gls24 family envelope stress response protein [Caldiserica bacterium CG02_land_8_20_14_3_00_36_38]|jgi:uncharacterized alkaline shock family protein YloU|nr:Asp23/Gls24 family envelope stress response protein [Caldisericota bacterium]OIP14102.1 MAG: hypothetical protein AUJ99_00190 [Caldisericum sp. CG2_30_36_11]PIP49491.1 MAG: Asp23/Gls24 family envelope stress response protein [Caldiserica bacterium CG23_combo_of_CG06-09_8_20_14_all_35_60]PIV55376.1 MAG: Asp23/Gls24 family envelope stress response protein [Caldiserica bacterium CG02_land_8_20_14_3_00_36_38]PIX29666.1 MAG: Asp23/Gls24 family envelope stress response protein [Caldiserica bacteri
MGKIIISQNSISKLAALAVMECYGVVGLVPARLGDRFLSLLGKENLSRGVDVKIDGKNVTINLYVILQGGIKVSEVANTIISQVSYKMKKLTGIENIDVNVVVRGIRREEYLG